ncbi:MAG: hypothetical protein ACRDKZ_09140, partial [Actinomycetota bacterium]
MQGIRINFQLDGSERVCGYAPDYGDEYNERHGLRYGWNFDHTDVTRDRDRSDDQLLDTLSHFHRGGVWEIEVPNGVHDVKVVIGDAQHESLHTLSVEGVSYWDELYLDESEWRAEKRTVAVTDGRLTLDPGDAPDKATRINYIEIDAQGAAPGCGDDEPTPVPSESPTPEPTPTVEPAPTPTQAPDVAPVRVNFQTEGTRVPCQYAADYGDTFRERNGLSYGWNVDHTDVTRDRGVKREQRLDTLGHFHQGGVWELAVANGPHQVTVSVGDPSYGASHTINVEGVNFINRLELDANEFKLVTADVAVTDGRLTIDQGAAGEMATHINFVEVDAFVERDCAKNGGSKEDPEPKPEPTPKPKPKPKPKAPHLPSRPNGLRGLKRIFGKHCNGR